MFYLQVTMELDHANVPKFLDNLENRFVPVATKHGMRLVGAFQTAVGTMDEITDIWAFDNLEHYAQVFRSLAKDPEWQSIFDEERSLVRRETTKFLRALPFSPLR